MTKTTLKRGRKGKIKNKNVRDIFKIENLNGKIWFPFIVSNYYTIQLEL
jgi:hypothetical protein